MKTIASGFQSGLAQSTTYLCWLVQIRVRDDTGDTFRLTSNNEDFIDDAVTYYANPGFTLTSVRISAGGQAAVIELTVGADDTSSEMVRRDIIDDRFKRAVVRVKIGQHDRQDREPVLFFHGYVSDIAYSDGPEVTLECKTRWAEARSIAIATYGPSCRWMLGDDRCGVDLTVGEGFAYSGTVTAVTNRRSFTCTISGIPEGIDGSTPDKMFANGAIRFTSGDNSGESYDIRKWDNDGGIIKLWVAATRDIAVDDTFDIHLGCDRTTGEYGCAKFSNIPNFGGFPFLPPPDFNFGLVSTQETTDE